MIFAATCNDNIKGQDHLCSKVFQTILFLSWDYQGGREKNRARYVA